MSAELSIAPDVRESTALYRFYDSLNSLLYVGITSSLPTRLAQHDKVQNWWPLVARIDVEHHPERSIALIAETAAIRDESPRFNKHHSRGDLVTNMSFRVPRSLRDAARDIAEERQENVSDVLREALERYVRSKR